jgi:uncharacterized protein (DUF488 family)
MNSKPQTKPVLFTIGHSNHELDDFIALLKQHDIGVVADVRSSPYSRFHSQFNREVVKAALQEAGIQYLFLGEALGARRTEPECLVGQKVKFDLVARLPSFVEGLDRLRKGASEYRVALMCAEKDPLDCHRTILVCRNLRSDGIAIRHILDDGSLETQESVESRLLAAAKLPPGDLFDTKETLLEQAYDRQGEKIAYEETLPETEEPY